MSQMILPRWATPPENNAFATDRGWEIKNGNRLVILTSHRGLKAKVDALTNMTSMTVNSVKPEPTSRHVDVEITVPTLPNVEDVFDAADDDTDSSTTDILVKPKRVIKTTVKKR